MTRIRIAEPKDKAAIYAVEEAAFARTDEADLVERLEQAGKVILSLVAEEKGRVVGHILFTGAEIRWGKKSHPIVCLAPLAVHPDFQKKGIGAALVWVGIDLITKAGHARMFVLGHPDYYPRFGFEPAAKHKIKYWDKNVPKEAVMVLDLVEDALIRVAGKVYLAPEFDGV